MKQATGAAGVYQGPVRVVSPLEHSIGQSWWAPIEQMRPRKGLTRLDFLSHEIAGCHSIYPPLGYYHAFEKQMFGRALSRVFAEAGLELVAGAGGRAEAFQSRPGMLACQLRGLSQIPRCVCFLLLQGGEVVSTEMCVRTHSYTFDVSGLWGVAGFAEPPPSLTFPSCVWSDCV